MINIFGIRIVTGKDWDDLTKEVKTIADEHRELKADSVLLKCGYFSTNTNVTNFMDFVMTRMPMKRHRKKAREYFPKS